MFKKKIRNKIKEKRQKFFRRKHRVNTVLKLNSDLPRLIVFRSNKYIYAQVVDKNGKVLASANDLKIKEWTKTERAYKVWQLVAERALKAWIEKVAFDRNWYKYHGRVKALADGARQWGLKF